MARFKQEAGDFTDGKVHYFEKGIFKMARPWKMINKKYPASRVIKIEEASQENISGFKWGAIGLVAFGGLGLIAGALTGGTRTTFILEFDDDKSCMCTAKQKVFISMLAEVRKYQKEVPIELTEADMKRKIIKNITSTNLEQWGIKTPSIDEAVEALEKLLFAYTPAEINNKPELMIDKLKDLKPELLLT